MGEELADSLLTGEMSLLLLVWFKVGELAVELGFNGICHEGILEIAGVDGNCLLWVVGEQTRTLNKIRPYHNINKCGNIVRLCEKSLPMEKQSANTNPETRAHCLNVD